MRLRSSTGSNTSMAIGGLNPRIEGAKEYAIRCENCKNEREI